MYPVIKKAGFTLANAPSLMKTAGSTFVVENHNNPDGDFLKNYKSHVRSFEEVVNYLPNQVYIGGEKLEELSDKSLPFSNTDYKDGKTEGKYGQIITEEELYLLLRLVDEFDLVYLSEDFVNEHLEDFKAKFPELEKGFSKIQGKDIEKGKDLIETHHAEALYVGEDLVGYVKGAHDSDQNLSAEYMLENLAVKATGVLSGLHVLRDGIDKDSIDYVIECSEEACGDVNQRGGGNFAKAIAETLGLGNATGSDTRGFCAAPVHSIIEASALVKSGVYKNVLIVAGGCIPKLGMNARDHVKKDLPIFEDVLAGFAVLISENDGVSPEVRTDVVGRHTVNTGSSPQAVITSLVAKPLKDNGFKITDVDKFSPEMQNPDITVPAGAGNVPEANYKMIGALAVKNGELDRKELPNFIKEKGMVGWAPTQGHIPSAAPYIGQMIDDIMEGKIERAMLIGKGSLFLGRMTNLFDGVSVLVQKNSGESDDKASTTSSNDSEEIRNFLAEALRKISEDLTKEA
ncbi:glycine/sarcosine/betaine reductase complex component C subunit beta [uncultured Anaerococcus sp.]|uniref:glycine/sarcosine/betaine reductase complex component C subunit beta n=1 Tax=uncultured Anaerococcus sp. TaxID=293428 RepID=UPI0026328DAD|nr:glycine/sarcosine/betaine reductase complex component C subunit beta [uncultured Anaerococcus sp.]